MDIFLDTVMDTDLDILVFVKLQSLHLQLS